MLGLHRRCKQVMLTGSRRATTESQSTRTMITAPCEHKHTVGRREHGNAHQSKNAIVLVLICTEA